MLRLKPRSKKGGSRSQIDIEDIVGGIIKIPGGTYCQVLSTSSINFELKSEEEQDALIDTFEDFLNSIGFPLQFLIRTREIDIDDYLLNIREQTTKEPEAIFKEQLNNYHSFIASLVASNKILTRTFYVIIPFSSPKNADQLLIKNQLNLRADIVIKNLARLGIQSRELDSIKIIDLFYSFYSPELSKSQPIAEIALQVINQHYILGAKK
jgi:hypothetical protein